MTDMMDERNRNNLDVMISSTSLDLPVHRKQAIDAVMRARMRPSVMEHLSASNKTAIDVSLRMVDLSEIYVGIFGMRYGHVPKDPIRNPDNLSITELEYRRAVERKIPILIYIMDKNHPAPATVGEAELFFEQSEEGNKKLKALKEKFSSDQVVGFFKSPEDLRILLIQSLNDPEIIDEALRKAGEFDTLITTDKPSIPRPPSLYSIFPYDDATKFIGRKKELEKLNAWVQSSDPIMVLDGIGGMGKSALAWQWIKEYARGVRPDLAGIIWWSFYETGQTLDSFTRHALAYVNRDNPDSSQIKDLTFQERTDALLEKLDREPYLLILDGFERALIAYQRWDVAQMRDTEEKLSAELRDVTDPRDSAALRRMAALKHSKILINTRLMPRPLEENHTPINGVMQESLDGLMAEDAYHLMEHYGIKSNDRDHLDAFMKRLGYHSLLLKIVAGLINRYRTKPGDFDAWYADEGKNLHIRKLTTETRKNILNYALKDLDPVHQKLLSQISAFADSVNYDAISIFNPYVRQAPARVAEVDNESSARQDMDSRQAHAQLASQRANEEKNYQEYKRSLEYKTAMSRFDAALTDLEDRGLLNWNRKENVYDLHPVVRGYSFELLNSDDHAPTHDRIYDYFQKLPEESNESAKDISDLRQTIAMYKARLGAGKKDEAIIFYHERLSTVLLRRLAAYHYAHELLLPFFPDGYDQLPALDDPKSQSICLNDFANVLYSLGRREKARVLNGLQLQINCVNKQTEDLCIGLQNYAISLEALDNFAGAHMALELSRQLAEVTGYKHGLGMASFRLLSLYKTIGEWEEALRTYDEFNANLPTNEPMFWKAEAEKYHAEILFHQNIDASEALNQARDMATKHSNTTVLRLVARWQGEIALRDGNWNSAADHFNQAIELAHRAGTSYSGASGGLARAYAIGKHHDRVRELLSKGIDDIDAAEVYLLLGNHKLATKYASKAYTWAWSQGPHYIRWWEFNRAKNVYKALNIPVPSENLPRISKAKAKAIPYKTQISALIREIESGNNAANSNT